MGQESSPPPHVHQAVRGPSGSPGVWTHGWERAAVLAVRSQWRRWCESCDYPPHAHWGVLWRGPQGEVGMVMGPGIQRPRCLPHPQYQEAGGMCPQTPGRMSHRIETARKATVGDSATEKHTQDMGQTHTRYGTMHVSHHCGGTGQAIGAGPWCGLAITHHPRKRACTAGHLCAAADEGGRLRRQAIVRAATHRRAHVSTCAGPCPAAGAEGAWCCCTAVPAATGP
jgi:hypothetical protein